MRFRDGMGCAGFRTRIVMPTVGPVMALFDDLVLQAMGAFASVIANTEANAELRLRACVAAAIDFVTVDPRRGRFVIESQATQQLRARRQQLVATLAEFGAHLVGNAGAGPTLTRAV